MAASLPPPLVWQNDLHQRGQPAYDGRASHSRELNRRFQSSEATSEAYRHATEVAQCRRDADLYDLLSATRREDTYQPYITGLPAMVQEKFRACQTMCFCGLFPELRRAWASVDNCLYLWQYETSGDVPIECGGVDQAICAVGLARPAPDIFLPGIQHVIVLCTPVEIMLLGVCPVGSAGSGLDHLSVQPLPRYCVPSDNVVMTCTATTACCRIFMGGADGHVYELKYGVADTWRTKKCSKVRITGSLQQYLPGFVPYMFGLRPPSPVEALTVDNERSILYVLSQSGAIQVFDLGASGLESARRVAELSDFYQAASAAVGGKELFRGSSERKGSTVKHISPIAQCESSRLHLLAVTADGRRVYFTTLALRGSSGYAGAGRLPLSGQNGAGGAEGPRPVALTAVYARPALPHAGLALNRLTAADMNRPAALEVVSALYAHGCLLLSEASSSNGRTTKLQMASRNLLLPPPSVNTGVSSSLVGLRELVTELDSYIPGQTCAMCAALQGSVLGPEVQRTVQDELAGQLFSPPPRFVLISTAGVVELEKRRPLDVLAAILQDRNAERVHQFFDSYGAPEAAAMCFALAAARPGAVPAVAAREAAVALENRLLVGEPRMPQDLLAVSAQQQAMEGSRALSTEAGAGIYMGQAVNPNPEPDWSAVHKGLCLYLLRLLQPVWEQPLLVAGHTDPRLVACYLSPQTMAVVQDKLQCLEAFLGDMLARRQQAGYVRFSPTAATLRGFASGQDGSIQDQRGNEQSDMAKRQRLTHAAVLEDERMARTRALVSKTAEALVLLRILHDHNIGRLAQRLDDTARRTLKGMVLRDMVYDPDGEAVVAQLISVLITQQLEAVPAGSAAVSAPGSLIGGGAGAGAVDAVAEQLQAQCPAYFKEEDRTFYQASAKLKAAQSATSTGERDRLVQEAVAQYLRVPLACNLEYVTAQLAYLKQFEGIVEIPLAAAAAHDPEQNALRPELGADCERARQLRGACYAHILQALRSLSSYGAEAGPGGAKVELSSSERSACQAAIFKAALQSTDMYFHQVLYGALLDLGAVDELLGRPWPYLEAYLELEGGLRGAKGAATAAVAAVAAVAGGGLGSVEAATGPLTRRQISLLELLTKLLIGKRRFREAAGVYYVLATRRSGQGEMAVSLEERVANYQSAVLQAKSEGDSQLVERMEADARVAGFQLAIAHQLQAHLASAANGTASELERQLADLQQGLRGVSELYNDYAQPLRMWGICLQLVDFTGAEMDSATMRLLWDHVLLQTWEQARASPHARRVRRAAVAMQELGVQFYPSESSFPTAHVTFRLEQMAAGLWPGPSTAGHVPTNDNLASSEEQRDDEAVPLALVNACHGSVPAAQRTYELLLARRAPGVQDAPLSSPHLRTQLLTSLLVLIRLQAEGGSPKGGGLYPGGPLARDAAHVSDACDKYALEARRLGGSLCEALARAFDELKRGLEAGR